MFGKNKLPFHCLPWAEKYKIVLASKRWKELRSRIIAERGRCERCKTTISLQLHHKTYDRLGMELDSDVELVCVSCHEIADEERAERGRSKSYAALYEARLDGWATKKHGDNWREWEEEITIEFDDWCERHWGE